MTIARALALPLVAALLAACGSPAAEEKLPPPRFLAEMPTGSSQWTPIPAEPGWVAEPPSRDGWLRFAVVGRSNLRSIAATGPRPSAEQPIVKAVTDALTPVAGTDEAKRAADIAKTKASLILRACREERVSMKMIPGNTLCTAWALWEVDVEDVAAAVSAEKRDAARAALLALPTVMSEEK